MQTINVTFGGTLIQDMYHETNTKEDPYGVVHSVRSESGDISFKVNSRHHQAINKLGDGLVSLLKHNKDYTIEAISHVELPIFCVQWHPEDLYVKNATEYIINNLNRIMRK